MSVIVAETWVAARPEVAGSRNRSAAMAETAGFSTAVPAPTSRQNPAQDHTVPSTPSAHAAPITASAAAAAARRDILSSSGAQHSPTARAATPPVPRSHPISAELAPLSRVMSTRKFEYTVNGTSPRAAAPSSGQIRRAIPRSVGP
nr:hypothetical protein [Kocuria salsicia]